MRLNLHISLYLLGLYFIPCLSFKFDQKYFGVTFTPYVKQPENDDQSFTTYTRQNIETMLTVISNKFAKILVTDDYSLDDQYIPESTYQHDSYASIYTGEIAAKINKKNDRKILTVSYEIQMMVENLNAEVPLVFEAAEKANRIFPGTVEAIIFGGTSTLSQTNRILEYLQSYKNKSVELGIKLGGEMIDCYGSLSGENETIVNAERKLVEKLDLITCGLMTPENPEIGPKKSFNLISQDLLTFRDLFKKINGNAELFIALQWSTGGEVKWETAENQKDYWETASTWAGKEKFTIFLDAAFDNPFRLVQSQMAHLGWWRLHNNSLINSIEGYVEKIPAKTIGKGKVNDDTKNHSSTPSSGTITTMMTPSFLMTILVILFAANPIMGLDKVI